MTEHLYPPDWSGSCSWHDCDDVSMVKLNEAELCQRHFEMEMAAMGDMLRRMIQMAMES